MNSKEKLDQALAGAGAIEPEDEQTARMLQMLTMAKPVLGGLIPEDPEELDAQLLSIADWLLGLYSDSADPNVTGILASAKDRIELLQEHVADMAAIEAEEAEDAK